MFKLSTSTLSALAAVALTAAAAAPSFAWGWVVQNSATQVTNRDLVLQQELAANQLRLGGLYPRLANQERAIRMLEQRELIQNGGFLTNAQQIQLNAQEDNLQRQINNINLRW